MRPGDIFDAKVYIDYVAKSSHPGLISLSGLYRRLEGNSKQLIQFVQGEGLASGEMIVVTAGVYYPKGQ